jgi:integrase
MSREADQNYETALVPAGGEHTPALRNAIRLWADSSTVPDSARREDLLRDKQRAVTAFFLFAKKHPGEVIPQDVKNWQASLEADGLRPATIYVRVSFLSSFYAWVMRDPELGGLIGKNPVSQARPRAPKPYQTESVKALTDEELERLLETVGRKAAAGDVVGKRDYSLLLLFVATGMRRAEILSLRGRDVRADESLILTSRIKGGNYAGREVAEPRVREALLDYLTAAGRLDVLKTDGPVWTRHDHAGRPSAALTSHSYVKNLKRYAREAGVDGFHLHRTRHTFARMVAEDSGSITETQDALGHKSAATTRVYVQRIAVRRDRHSEQILGRFVKRSTDDALEKGGGRGTD